MHDIREAVRLKQPLIHCITNPISINQCANGILAIGARPIMAEHCSSVRVGSPSSLIVACIVWIMTEAVSASVPSKSSIMILLLCIISLFYAVTAMIIPLMQIYA